MNRLPTSCFLAISALFAISLLAACGGDDSGTPGPDLAAAAAPGMGGNGTGAALTGGVTGTGSVSATGGAAATGNGATGGDGTAQTGGFGGLGGASGLGGIAASGGTDATGGVGVTGGSSAMGGTAGTGDCNTPPPPSPLVGWASVNGSTTGGGTATPLMVTTLSELQGAAAGSSAAVIHVKGVLSPGSLSIGSNKTIVGLCGAEIHGHVELSGSTNVIIRNIKIVGYGVGDCALDPDYDSAIGCSSGQDAISLANGANHIWFDHCDVSDGTDGNLDITNGSNFVTVSWTKFHYTPRTDDQGEDSTGASGHRYSNLVGNSDTTASEDASALNVTWHHNWWADNVRERQPRVRFGQNHLFNNLWSSTNANYCVRAGIEANILLEGNYFDGVETPMEFNNSSDQGTAHITADSSNVFDATSGERATGGGGTPFTDPPYTYTVESASVARSAIQSAAGPQ